METATWLSVFILGPGAVCVFAWFVAEIVRLLRTRPDVTRESQP